MQANRSEGHRRYRAISDVECGRVQVSLVDLLMIAAALEKPISYFFPSFFSQGNEGGLAPDEAELLLQYRKILDDKLRAVALQQITSLADMDVEAYMQKMCEEYEEWKRDKGE